MLSKLLNPCRGVKVERVTERKADTLVLLCRRVQVAEKNSDFYPANERISVFGDLVNSGFREFGNSGIQEFGNSGIQEFRNSGIREFGNSGIRDFGNW